MIKKPKMEIDDCSMTRQIPKALYEQMIDALIEAYHTLKPTVDKYGIHCSGGESETLRDIKQVLLKAGCTL